MKEILDLVKKHQDEIVLLVGVILVSLLSFSAGYLMAKQQNDQLRFESLNENKESSHNWSGDIRIVS